MPSASPRSAAWSPASPTRSTIRSASASPSHRASPGAPRCSSNDLKTEPLRRVQARRIRPHLARRRAAAGRQSAARRRADPVLQAGRGRSLACRAAPVRPERSHRPDRGQPAAGAEAGRRSRCRRRRARRTADRRLSRRLWADLNQSFPQRRQSMHFADGRSGTITISAARARRRRCRDSCFADNGRRHDLRTCSGRRSTRSSRTRRNEGGTGLGLHIVYNLVTQQLGGRMMLESRLGQGTTFSHYHPEDRHGRQGEPTITDAAARRNQSMAEQDDVLQLIDDSGRAPRGLAGRKWKIAVIDDDHAVHEGTPLCAERLQPERPDAGDPVGLFRRRRQAC